MKVKFWGTRGSIPVPGRSTLIHGGNTSSIQVTSYDNDQIFLDAGSGLREAGIEFMKHPSSNEIHLFMSHFHWDHVLGLPFFIPFYDESFHIHVYGLPACPPSASVDFGRRAESRLWREQAGMANNQNNIEGVIDSLISPPLFPITKNEFKAKVTYNNISPDSTYEIGNLKIKTFQVNHQCCTLAYKIEEKNRSFVYVTDNEIKYSRLDLNSLENDIAEHNVKMIEFCRGADYLVHDTTYTLNDYLQKVGWGHSNNISAAILATLAEVKNLVLFHYDPEYNDEKIESLLKDTNSLLKRLSGNVNCLSSKDGMELEF